MGADTDYLTKIIPLSEYETSTQVMEEILKWNNEEALGNNTITYVPVGWNDNTRLERFYIDSRALEEDAEASLNFFKGYLDELMSSNDSSIPKHE